MTEPTYRDGLKNGQLLMVATVRNMIKSKSSLKTMELTLDLIVKQLKGEVNEKS